MGNKNFILGNCILRMRTCNNYFFLKGWGLIYFLIYMYCILYIHVLIDLMDIFFCFFGTG